MIQKHQKSKTLENHKMTQSPLLHLMQGWTSGTP